MELWIRVQKNKKIKQGLCKVDDLIVEKDEENEWVIRQSCDTVGIYKTEKRALEVLDEIQKKLSMKRLTIPAHNCNFDKYNSVSCIDTQMNIIYEMPEE